MKSEITQPKKEEKPEIGKQDHNLLNDNNNLETKKKQQVEKEERNNKVDKNDIGFYSFLEKNFSSGMVIFLKGTYRYLLFWVLKIN